MSGRSRLSINSETYTSSYPRVSNWIKEHSMMTNKTKYRAPSLMIESSIGGSRVSRRCSLNLEIYHQAVIENITTPIKADRTLLWFQVENEKLR